MKKLALIFLLFSFKFLYAAPLTPVRGEALPSLLAYQFVLEEKLYGNYTIKIITAATASGECWGKISSCPDARLYILIVPDGLYENPRLYQLPKSKGWAFDKWVTSDSDSDTGLNSKSSKIEFTLKTALPDANVDELDRKKFIAKFYRIKY